MPNLTRSTFALVLLMLPLVGSSSPTDPAACSDHLQNWKTRSITCRMPAAAVATAWRLEIAFSGSHDDTSLALSAMLEGEPLTCDPGSKTRSDFEDGAVTLSCHFTVPARSTTDSIAFGASVKFHHADYEGFALKAR